VELLNKTEDNGATGTTLGMDDTFARTISGTENALADFDVTDFDTAPEGTNLVQYFSAGKNVSINGFAQIQDGAFRPNVYWGSGTGTRGGSDNGGRVHAADILAHVDDGAGNITYKYFLKADQIAAALLGYNLTGQFWDNGFGALRNGTVTSPGTLVTGTAADCFRNFMRYVLDIDAMVVYDANLNGLYNTGDAVLFSLVDDSSYMKQKVWNEALDSNVDTPFAGRYFSGNTIFLYSNGTVQTYFDPGTGIFFGSYVATANNEYFMTILAGQNNPARGIELQGLDIGNYVTDGPPPHVVIPEPSTILLIIGSGLALGAGILRKRVR
jgi:hypothetical protein